MQSVAGAAIRVAWIASNSESASLRPIVLVLERVEILATLQIFFAIGPVTRENVLVRNCVTVMLGLACSSVISRPSSTPYGCGLISFGSAGSRSAERAK